MDLLNELVFILTKSGKAQNFSSKFPASSRSKSRVLFDALVEGKVKNDADAAELVYGTSPKDKKYLMLKRSLVTKLSQAIHETDYSEIGEENYVSIAFDCREKISVADRLLKQNVFHNAEKIIKKTLDVARKYQLNEVELDGLKQLRVMYSLNGDVKKLQATTVEIDRLYEEIGHQTKAEGFVQLLKARLLYSIGRTAEVEEVAIEALEHIGAWQITNKNIFLERLRHAIEILRCRMTNNTDMMQAAVETYDKFLEKNSFLRTRISDLLVLKERIRYQLASAKFNEAKATLTQCLKLADYRSFDKFEVQTLHFEYCMKTADYVTAGKIVREVNDQPQFELVYAPDRAAWLVRQAYLYFALLNTGKETMIEEATPAFGANYSYQAFLSEAKAVQKDKQGYNVAFQIISLLLAAERDMSTIDYEGGSMKIYFHRHMKEMREERTQIFFKWCYQLANRHFQQKDKCMQNEVLEKLAKVKGIRSGSCELIPYEDLVYWVVDRYCKF